MTQGKIVIAGGNGFLGGVLARWLSATGWEVVILTRCDPSQNQPVRHVTWDGRTIGPWAVELEGAAAVINLAGRSVNCRYTKANKKLILDSRIHLTRALGEALGKCKRPSPVWLNSSTATIYRHSLDKPMDEATGEIGPTPAVHDAFSIEVATAWEAALAAAVVPGVRKIAMRTGIVLAPGAGGPFDILHRLVRCGLGGTIANGKQYVSWIHAADFCRAVEWLIDTPEISGAVNITSPHPVPNREFMAAFRAACRARFGLPASRCMLQIAALLLRTEAELMLKSRRVIPGRLRAGNFIFRFPEISGALNDLVLGVLKGGRPAKVKVRLDDPATRF